MKFNLLLTILFISLVSGVHGQVTKSSIEKSFSKLNRSMDDVNLVVVHGIGEMERGDNTNQNQTNMNAMYTVQNPTIEVTDECIFLSYSYQEKYDRNTKLLTIPLNKICSFKVDSFKLPRGIDKPRLIILVCD